MKATTVILSLALAATGLAAPNPESHNVLTTRADSKVLIDKDAGFPGKPGRQENIDVSYNKCRDVPSTFFGQISAISPNGDLSCRIYSGKNCTGSSPPQPVTQRVQNLALNPWNFDDLMTSLNCTHAR